MFKINFLGCTNHIFKCSITKCGQWLTYPDSTIEHFHHHRKYSQTALFQRDPQNTGNSGYFGKRDKVAGEDSQETGFSHQIELSLSQTVSFIFFMLLQSLYFVIIGFLYNPMYFIQCTLKHSKIRATGFTRLLKGST